jgi:hypothetical protein
MGTYDFVHCGSTEKKYPVVVRELYLVNVRAVVFYMPSVVDIVVLVNEANASDPIPGGLCMIRIGLIPSICS